MKPSGIEIQIADHAQHMFQILTFNPSVVTVVAMTPFVLKSFRYVIVLGKQGHLKLSV